MYEDLRKARPVVDFAVELSSEQVDFFWNNGYVAVERITTDDELEWLGAIYDRLFDDKTGGIPGGYFDLSRPYESAGTDLLPQVLHPAEVVPELLDTACVRNGRRLAAQLFNAAESELEVWGHMIQKPARIGAELPWHQDEAYWHPGYVYRAMGLWMPLDPATSESGCLSFLPGSHRGEVRPHKHIADDPAVHGLVTESFDASGAVEVPLSPGAATLHHCRTLHRSAPNRSAHIRRAVANEFQLPAVKNRTPDSRPWLADQVRAWAKREPIAASKGQT